MTSPITVALVGNPNVGVTSLFNALTGSNNPVANYPRVTTSISSREITHDGRVMRVVDVPGIFSVNSQSPDEKIGQDYFNDQHPDIIVNVLDAGHLDRHLFLSTQLIETGIKRITVLNMIDEARRNGIVIDTKLMADALGSPVIATNGLTKEGVDDLKAAIAQLASSQEEPLARLRYDQHLEDAIARVQDHLDRLHPQKMTASRSRWLAIKLLEGDDDIIRQESDHPEFVSEISQERSNLEHTHDQDAATMLASARFAFAHGLLLEARQQEENAQDRFKLTRTLDNFFLNRTLGLPLLLAIMWIMFETTFSLGAIPTEWIKAAVDWSTKFVDGLLPEGMFHDMVVNGVMAGVGGTIVFLPNIVILFFFMAILSGTGYLSRASFLMDRIMHRFGLHGTTLIPMVAGFGCNVPAVMATNIISNKRARLIAILISPFMSCSARLPTFILFSGAFFSRFAGTVVFAMYMASIAAAMISAILLNRIIPGSGSDAFVMELPPYRIPTLHSVLHHMWDSAQGFVAKVTGVILAGSIVIWFLQEFPRDVAYSQDYNAAISTAAEQPESDARTETLRSLSAAQAQEKLEKSYLGRASIAVTPMVKPLGFSWHESSAIMTGFVAKEVVVATYAVIYAQEKGSSALTEAIAKAMPASTALAFMIFTLLYAPCMSTLTIIARETGSWKWAGVSLAYSLSFAWMLAFLFNKIGTMLL